MILKVEGAKLMTAQEYYDLLVEKARADMLPCIGITEKWPDKIPGLGCKYREQDKACVFGLLIKDEKYEESMEGKTAQAIMEKYPDCFTPVDNFSNYDYNHIQWAHDDNWKSNNFKEVFIQKINALPCFSRVKQVQPD